MRNHVKDHKRVVIKVGTTTLTYPNGKMNLRTMERFAWVLTDLKNRGIEVILVTSGAIAVGTTRLNLPSRPRDIHGKQAASAVGQAVLMQMYENFFMQYNQLVAQILLTKDVIENKERMENAKNTFSTLLSMGVIPIVNENDTVSIEELEFSDNDTLSAYVATLVNSDVLIILSDIDGLYDKDPKAHQDASLIPYIEEVSDKLFEIAGGSRSDLGTGGMKTKIKAAQMATTQGIDVIIAHGESPEIVFKIFEGEEVGTLFRGNRK